RALLPHRALICSAKWSMLDPARSALPDSGACPMCPRSLLPLACLLVLASRLPAQDFDHYVNPVLTKVPAAKAVKELKQPTIALIRDHDRILPRTTGALLVVRTNDGRFSKLLVLPARQKLDKENTVPILYIERFVTYKEGEERTVVAGGQKLSLFPGFRLS